MPKTRTVNQAKKNKQKSETNVQSKNIIINISEENLKRIIKESVHENLELASSAKPDISQLIKILDKYAIISLITIFIVSALYGFFAGFYAPTKIQGIDLFSLMFKLTFELATKIITIVFVVIAVKITLDVSDANNVKIINRKHLYFESFVASFTISILMLCIYGDDFLKTFGLEIIVLYKASYLLISFGLAVSFIILKYLDRKARIRKRSKNPTMKDLSA